MPFNNNDDDNNSSITVVVVTIIKLKLLLLLLLLLFLFNNLFNTFYCIKHIDNNHRDDFEGRKEGNILFNDVLITFYLWLYGIRHMVEDHSDSKRENPLLPHRLLFPISGKGSFICIIPQTG